MTDNDAPDVGTDPLELQLQAWGNWARDTAEPVTAELLTAPPFSRARRDWPRAMLVAAIVMLALVGGVLWARSSGPLRTREVATAPATPNPAATVAPLSCPAAFAMPTSKFPRTGWVPAPPSGVATGGKLVPRRTPVSIVVCAYLGGTPHTPARTVLGGDLSAVTSDLSTLGGDKSAARGCPDYVAVTDADDYLIGLRFGTGIVWVSAPGNHCSGSSNGVDFSGVNLRADAQQAYRGGRWDTDPSVTKACSAASTRGSGNPLIPLIPLIPPGPTSATICVYAHGATRAFRYPNVNGSLTDVNSLASMITFRAAVLTPAGCTVNPADGGTLVIFDYATRPSVVLAATPSCANGKPASHSPGGLVNDLLEFQIGRR